MRDTPTSPDTPSREELAALRAIHEGTEKHLLESEEQEYRDLFEEAPIGYVKEDLESRFVTANRAAIRILGLKTDEVVGTIGMSLVADTPENKQHVREAFASIGQGRSTGGVVIELRRKDDGRPIWGDQFVPLQASHGAR